MEACKDNAGEINCYSSEEAAPIVLKKVANMFYMYA